MTRAPLSSPPAPNPRLPQQGGPGRSALPWQRVAGLLPALLLPALLLPAFLLLPLPAPVALAQPPGPDAAPQVPSEPPSQPPSDSPPESVGPPTGPLGPPPPEAAAEPPARDVPEPGSGEAIRRHTTAPQYLPESVASVPESATVPSPSDVFGDVAGAPDRLSSVAEIHGYFRQLAAASDRVRVRTLGVSEEGRDMLLVLISSPRNLDDLPRIADVNRQLADPRFTDRETARALAAGGKGVYYLLGGLHSTETGPPEMLMELAYRLAVSERPEIRRIRDELVVALTPVVEPDGRDRVVQWYERHLRGREREHPWEELREILSPPYWGHYVFHDNNRDGLQRTLALTRAVHDAFYELRPQVVHDLHESLPLLYISTGHGPYSTAVDPVTINRWTWFAHNEAAALQAEGLPGVWVWGFWDGWWPGYLVSVASNHHAVGRFYETFGNSHPGTFERDLGEVELVGKPVTEVQWYRPWPPPETVTWSLRNNTNYMQAGVLEALDLAARHREELLLDVWAKAARSLEKGRTEPPFAWVFPADQDDPARLAYLVGQLRDQGIEVHRVVPPPPEPEPEPPSRRGARRARPAAPAAGPAAGPGGEAAPGPLGGYVGSYVVRMDQPLRDLALTLLDDQGFPPDEPNPPYDDVAWTLPRLYGVEGEAVADRAVLDLPMERVTGRVLPGGGVEGWGDDVFLLADRGQNGLLAARVLLGDHQVDAAEEPFQVDGVDYPAGSWIVQAPRDEVEAVASRLGLTFRAALAMPRVRVHLVDLPRLGLVHTWTDTQDAGWARYTLDRAGVAYELVSPADLRRAAREGGLRARHDVLLVPEARGDFVRLVHGIDPAWGPLAYTRTDAHPSHGVPNGADDVTGGMGLEGLLELQRFVEDGGVLVTLGNAGTLAVEGGLVRRVDRRPPSTVRSPGSEVAARIVQPRHPVTYGYPERTSLFRGNGPLFTVPDRSWGERVVVQFGDVPPEGVEEAAAPAAAPAGGEPTGVLPDEPPIEVEEIEVEPVPLVVPADDATAPGADEGDAEEGAEGGGTEGEAGEATTVEELQAAGVGDRATDFRLGEAGETPPRDLVLSGWVEPVEALEGTPAVLDLPAARGDGRVVLFAFNPLHRYLNHSDFRLLYNVLLHWNDLP